MFSGLREHDYSLHGLDPNFGSFVAAYDSPFASVRRTSEAEAVARKDGLELTQGSYVTGWVCVEIKKCHTVTTNKKYTNSTMLRFLCFFFNAVKKLYIYIYIYIYTHIYVYINIHTYRVRHLTLPILKVGEPIYCTQQ